MAARSALDHIKAALRQIGAIASGETPSAEQGRDGLAALNAMLEQWLIEPNMTYAPADGSSIDALATFDTLSTHKTFASGYDSAIKYNLAIELAPEYGAGIPQELYRNAVSAKANIKRNNTETPLMEFETEMINGTNYRYGYNINTDI